MPQYSCDSCGACCRFAIVEIEELDLVREPKLQMVCRPSRLHEEQILLNADDDEPYEPMLPGWEAGALLACGNAKPCPMLDGNRCSIYPSRPNVCVAFRAGSELCQEARASEGLPLLLPAADCASWGTGG